MSIRYAHTNIVARDQQRLITFYVEVFDCELVPPVRNIDAPWLAKGTAVEGATLRGAHLRLPGHGPDGPTLEIFEYRESVADDAPNAANRVGLRHLAFAVDDVDEMVRRVVAGGGAKLGETVNADIPDAGCITFTYVRDPEGNIVELQKWTATET